MKYWKGMLHPVVVLLSILGARAHGQNIIALHEGMNDPKTEVQSFLNLPGWSGGGGAVIEQGVDDNGTEAWEINDTGMNADSLLYRIELPGNVRNDLFENGWKLSANMRFVETPGPQGFTSNTFAYYQEGHGSDPATNQGFFRAGLRRVGNSLCINFDGAGGCNDPGREPDFTNGGPIDVPGDADAYHLYELEWNPLSRMAELLIDSVSFGSWTGRLNDNGSPNGRVEWGAGESGEHGHNFTNLAKLEEFTPELCGPIGDFDCSTVTNEVDFGILLANLGLGTPPVGGSALYFDGNMNPFDDSDVDLDDFNEFKAIFPGIVSAVLGTPEPSSVALALLGLASFAAGGRRGALHPSHHRAR